MESMNRLDELLENESHIVKILLGEQWEPIIVDPDIFDNSSSVQADVDLLYSFLRNGYYVDNFRNHGERRKWRGTLAEKYGIEASTGYMRTNCLRFNQWSQVTAPKESNALRVLIADYYTGSQRETLDALIGDVELIGVTRKEYDAQTVDEKVDYVKEVKRRLYAVLRFISTVKEKNDNI